MEEKQMFITLGRLRKLTNSLKDKSDDTKLTFEFMMMSLFPRAWSNIQEEMNRQHTHGYMQGLQDAENLKNK